MTREDAEAILRKVEYWHYPWELPWGTMQPTRSGVDPRRHYLRKQHFFEPLLDLYGGSLTGKDVLDLGCCQGFWSIEASRAGARTCVGIDSSEAFITEAKALATVLGRINCDFLCFHLEAEPWWLGLGRFHLTFFLGLFYHLTDPVFVLRKAASLTHETLIIDTAVSSLPGSVLAIVPRDLEEPTTRGSRISSGIRVLPTRDALRDVLSDAGFAKIHDVEPRPQMPAEYLDGRRVSIIAQRD